MNKKNGKTIGEMAASRYTWKLNPHVRIKPSGKEYKRNKKVKEDENKEQII